jgi:hypothetical protein
MSPASAVRALEAAEYFDLLTCNELILQFRRPVHNFKWLLNQRTATATLGQREILLEFCHLTALTAGEKVANTVFLLF